MPTKSLEDLLSIATEVCDKIANGNSLVAVCAMADMPSRQTVLNWRRTYPEIDDMFEAASKDRADYLVDEMIEIADTPESEESPAAVRNRVDVRKWAASKMNAKRYGDRIAIDGDMNVKLSDGQIESRLTQLLGKARAAGVAGRAGETGEAE